MITPPYIFAAAYEDITTAARAAADGYTGALYQAGGALRAAYGAVRSPRDDDDGHTAACGIGTLDPQSWHGGAR